ncbi:TadE/TadG family type IV pilus assembly protein [Qipengyuania sp. RANM35]|uniref:TadE/TadG family type IV pilus assembly protein n=1 Tax=Qipengyuania sp. RANM35 TaxID=3068635 RepID=UPI0034DB22C0
MIAALIRLLRSDRGTVVIETAIVLPVLAILILGGFEVSRIVARNSELQSAAAEAAAVVLANPPGDASEKAKIEAIVESSAGLATNKVTLTTQYRCNASTTLVSASTACGTNDEISEYIEIRMLDSYTPIWTSFGVGRTIQYDITRRVQVS